MLDYQPPEDRSNQDPAPHCTALAPRVPVVVVTGYLGSGKTMLITALLKRPDMAGTAVIVNELAEAGIDQSIIADTGADDVVLLSNSCLCCAAGSDLRNSVARLLRRSVGQPVKRILVETSGAADPGPILRQICFDPLLRSKLRYAGVLTLFDAQNGKDLLARDPVGLRQIGLADRILVTKTDLVGKDMAAAARRFLRALNPGVRVTQEREEAERFVGDAGLGVARAGASAWLGEAVGADPSDDHQPMLSTWSIYGRRPVYWTRTEQAIGVVFDRHGDDVLRTKGLLWTEGDDRPLAIHGINRHFHRPVRLARWDGEPMSRFVVIGFAGAAVAAAAIADAISGHAAPVLAGGASEQ